jgi:hypothetical protein
MTLPPHDSESAIGDLLHHLHSLGLNPFEILSRAASHFTAEAGQLKTTPYFKDPRSSGS